MVDIGLFFLPILSLIFSVGISMLSSSSSFTFLFDDDAHENFVAFYSLTSKEIVVDNVWTCSSSLMIRPSSLIDCSLSISIIAPLFILFFYEEAKDLLVLLQKNCGCFKLGPYITWDSRIWSFGIAWLRTISDKTFNS